MGGGSQNEINTKAPTGRRGRRRSSRTELDVPSARGRRGRHRGRRGLAGERGQLRDDLAREQDAHLALVSATRERADDMDDYEERAQHAAGSIDLADEEITRLREALRMAREQIDELLAERCQ